MFQKPDRNRGHNTNNQQSGLSRLSKHKRLIQASVLTAAVLVGGAWFVAVPEANGLTLDRQDRAADAAYRTQARGQQLAASHQAVREAFVETIPRHTGKMPDHESVHTAYSGTPDGDNNGNGAGAGPAESIAEPATIPHRVDERVVQGENGAFTTDGAEGSRQETADRYEAEVNADRPETPEQQKVTRLLDLWAPRYADAKSAHRLLDDSVAQAKAYSDAYFDSQTERIGQLDKSARNYDRLHGRMSTLLNTQRAHYDAWNRQASTTLNRSRELLAEMKNVNDALRFAEDAAGYDAMVSDAISMNAAMQDLAADLTGFEDNTIALMDAIGNPAPPPADPPPASSS